MSVSHDGDAVIDLNSIAAANESDLTDRQTVEASPTEAPPASSQTIFQRIRNDKSIQAVKGYEGFYTDDELMKYYEKKPGFRPLAAMNAYPNVNCHRLFRYGYQRLLTYDECRLSFILEEVDKIDDILESRHQGQEQQHMLPFDKTSFILRCQLSPDASADHTSPDTTNDQLDYGSLATPDLMYRRANLMSNFRIIHQDYRELFRWDYDTYKFRRVTRSTYKKIVSEIKLRFDKGNESFPPPSLDFLRALDDVVYLDADPPPEYLQRCLFSSYTWVKKVFLLVFCGRDLDLDHGLGVAYPEKSFKLAAKSLLGLLSAATFLTPVALLYFVPMSKGLSFGILVIFGVVFTVVLLSSGASFYYLWAGVAAYFAILTSFLANTMS